MSKLNTQTIEKQKIQSGTYKIDPVHSRVEFEVKHLGISTFRGSFEVYEGSIDVKEGYIDSINGKVDIGSIRVPEEQLVGHLLSPDFFDADNYPKGSLTAKGIGSSDDELLATGELTLRGQTHHVKLKVIVEGYGIGMDGSPVLSLSAEGEINREDYGISWGSTLDSGAAVVAEKVRIIIAVEAVRSES